MLARQIGQYAVNNGVSVVIPTHNRAILVVRAIESVLAATSEQDEILVIDDGSTDDTQAAVGRFGNAVKYVRIENSGPGAARNVGIRMATRPFVAFLDSDDLWVSDKVELQRNVLEAFPDVVFCFSNMFSTLRSGGVLHDLHSDWRNHVRIGSDSAPRLTDVLGPGVSYSSFAHLPKGRADFRVHIGDLYATEMEVHYVHSDAVMVRKTLAGPQFQYPQNIRLMEDWECFARLAKSGPVAYLDCELANLIEHDAGRLTDLDDIRHLTARIELLRRVWGSDEAFQRERSARYQRVLASKFLIRAKLLVAAGRIEEARDDLKLAGGSAPYRLMVSLPVALLQVLLQMRRAIVSLFE